MALQDFPEAQRIVYLISRFTSGVIDFAELQELDNWKRQSESNRQLFNVLLDEAKQREAIEKMQGYDSKGSLQKIKQAMAFSQNRTIVAPWIRIAIAASILVAAGLILFVSRQRQPQQYAIVKSHPEYIAPGSDKAILTLANGKKITINQNTKGVIAIQAGMQVRNAAGGTIVYTQSGETNNHMIEYNTIETPRAGKYHLQLPDGTNVWLNAASSLHYPVAFKGKTREVELTGEGYFEVAKDKTKPFSVTASGQKVTVLGTHFNINAYNDEPQVATTLVEGSVHVATGKHEALFKPGQQSLLKTGELNVVPADLHLATAWKNGQLAFLRTDLKTVLRQISRWYDIDVEYQGSVPHFTISGDVSREADLSAMLEILKLYDVRFVQEGRKLIILN
jgi:transmembrane sensor